MTENQNTGQQDQPEEGRPERVIIPFEQAKEARAAPTEPETEPEQAPQAAELTRGEVKGIVEALLFAAGSPLSTARLAELAGVTSAGVMREILDELKAEYDATGRAFTVEEIAGGYQLLTRPDFHPWVNKLRRKEHEDTLSQAALETLAIIAYRQPITRADVEDIRGVQSGYILRSLVERSLVRVAGRSDELGRPLLYATTREFLEVFGLPSLKALPKLDDLEPPSDAR